VNRRAEEPTKFVMDNTLAKEVSETWTETTSNKWHVGAKVEFTAKVNAIVAESELTVGMDFFWEHGKVSSTSTSTKETKQLRYGVSETVVKPGTGIHCMSYAVQGKSDLTWEGAAIIRFNGGSDIRFKSKGRFEKVEYSRSWSECKDIKVEDIKKKIGEGSREVDEVGKDLRKSPARRGIAVHKTF
jgi:hypothetical protein